MAKQGMTQTLIRFQRKLKEDISGIAGAKEASGLKTVTSEQVAKAGGRTYRLT